MEKQEEVEGIEIDGKFYNLEDTVYSEYLQTHIPRDRAIACINDDDQQDYITDDDCEGFFWTEDESIYVHESHCFYCEISEQSYYDTDRMVRTFCDTIGHEEELEDNDNWHYIERGYAEGHYLYYEDASWCEDIEEYVHCDDAHWCEQNECSYWDEDQIPATSNDQINSYHNSKNNVDYILSAVRAKFRIGFEIEKTEFDNFDGDVASENGDHVGECDLFAGYETDSSCGVEAVSHILPLVGPRHPLRAEVFNLFDKASCIIDSPYNTDCGGHLSISMIHEHDGYNLVDKIRQPLALIYALYRHRLKRTYCEHNKPAKKESNYKYSPVHVKRHGVVELRIPSAVRNVKQLKLRYDLMYKVLYYSIVRRVSFEVFLDKVKHIVLKMYAGNERKVEQIYQIARSFRKYLIAEEIGTTIEDFINPKKEE